ncbi:MAG: hypothetical protein R6U43_05515 [Candidatus Krumholzibacteriales bacterium]
MKETSIRNETFESRNLYIKASGSVRRGNYQSGKSYLEDAVKIAPENPYYLSLLGLCMAKEGFISRGKSLCSKAVSLAPDKCECYVNLGRVFLEEDLREEARTVFLRAYRIDKRNVDVAMELSRMGIRRPPVIPFLQRGNQLNIFLGKLRHSLLNRIKRT